MKTKKAALTQKIQIDEKIADERRKEKALTFVEAGIGDERMFLSLCSAHGFDAVKLREQVKVMRHTLTRRTMKKDGVERDTVIVRSKGSDSNHAIMLGKDHFLYCSCPSFVMHGGLNEVRPCKHLVYVIVNRLRASEEYLPFIVK